MKLPIVRVAWGVVVMVSLVTELPATEQEVDVLNLIKTAYASRLKIQTIAKDYLYIGNDVAVPKARKEMAASLKAFDTLQRKLSESLNDPKVTNLLNFVQMNYDELKDLLDESYSKDNAAVVIDLAEAIAEGEKKIADIVVKRSSVAAPNFMGQRYNVAQIAKYYIAYQSGLRDDVTVRQMRQTVERIDHALKVMKANPDNTPKMNRILKRIEKEWKIVHQFYLDIEEGGLPLIVYQTSNKLAEGLLQYFQEYLNVRKTAKGHE